MERKNGIGKMLGIVFLIVAATAVAPEIFSNTATLSEAPVGEDPVTPAWVTTLVILIAGFGLVFVIYRGSGMDKQ